ncbi:hypothetical protein KIN20_019900 [Parelaphostrongylus tenuis]|uniref:Protein farnesyltransferase subunit beta n=1 Tax=Parelaphostrongylus tenuis TaxID=148309 RepID=A0AAD5N3J6_PARTN|nr:hypothetical protein KIN20_019900 [Parelaphostrongylus tenuis]
MSACGAVVGGALRCTRGQRFDLVLMAHQANHPSGVGKLVPDSSRLAVTSVLGVSEFLGSDRFLGSITHKIRATPPGGRGGRAMCTLFRTCQKEFACNDDGYFTFSSTEQKRVEDLVSEQNSSFGPNESGSVRLPLLNRNLHVEYIVKSLKDVSRAYSGLDASRTWMCYWGLHSLNILGASPAHAQKTDILAFLKTCQHPDGGFGGGPGQYAHLAPTYASVMALASLQMEDALSAIDLKSLSRFLHRMKQPTGRSRCTLVVKPIFAEQWIIRCQTYEGGFGGEPFAEAHGGYAYCGVASLVILDRYRLADSESFLHWLVNRQMRFEGGFQGRTNKLVDGCYSFWQAANFPLIDGEMAREGRLLTDGLFDARMLEEYILTSCQDEAGGLRDKPGKSRDLYHTCYVLSGLAIAQMYSASRERDGVLGGTQNVVESINPVFNLTTLSEQFAISYFAERSR